MISLIIFITLCLVSVCISQDCSNEMRINCTSIDTNTTIIQVYGINPVGLCTLVQIGYKKIIYDPIMINSVWITLVNTNGCQLDPVVKAQELNYISTDEIVIISFTPQYYRIVLVPKECLLYCQTVPFSSEFERKLEAINNTQLFPIFNNLNNLEPYCLNGGILDSTYIGAGYKCICPNTLAFRGPRCEFMERRIITRQNYFNIFTSASNIIIKFSLYFNDSSGIQNIFSIKNDFYKEVFAIIISKETIIFKVEDKTIPIRSNTIDNRNWYDFYLNISQQVVVLMVNSSTISKPLSTLSEKDFRSFYLVLNEVTVHRKICIKNLIVNSKVIDLFGLVYVSCCNEICPCKSTEDCECYHVLPPGKSNCYCLYDAGNGCSEPTNYIQIEDSITLDHTLDWVNPIYRIYFRFRTLSKYGTLLTVKYERTDISLKIQIVNSNLILYIPGEGLSIINYNVSNGQLHNALINIKNYSVELVLDNNNDYTALLVNWFDSPSFPIVYQKRLTSIHIGEMKKPYSDTLNILTTCISDIEFNLMNDKINFWINNFDGLKLLGCNDGPKCASNKITCMVNQICNDEEWQNTKCICIPNFSSVNLSCTYTLCVINPCNYGTCYFNSAIDSYSCNCLNGYTGKHCENRISESTFWWIAVLLVLLLLLIILIILLIYCLCYRNPKKSDNSKITKIYEDVAIYNDQAGEMDYNGPPINMVMLKNAMNGKEDSLHEVSEIILSNFKNEKSRIENYNEDLILDHPLEYGFEGNNSENGSISSIGSKSVYSEEDI